MQGFLSLTKVGNTKISINLEQLQSYEPTGLEGATSPKTVLHVSLPTGDVGVLETTQEIEKILVRWGVKQNPWIKSRYALNDEA